MMHSSEQLHSASSPLTDYYSHSHSHPHSHAQLLPSMPLQQPPPLQPLTSSSAFTHYTALTQQPSLQHTMSVADPFSPSWQHYNPPSPASRKPAAPSVFAGASPAWLDSAQQLMPSVSSGGLAALGGMSVQQQLMGLNPLGMGMMQRAAQAPPAMPLHPVAQQPSSNVFQPMPQRAGFPAMQPPSSLVSPSSMQPQLGLQGGMTPQQLSQLRAAQQMQPTYSPQRVHSMAGQMAPMQQFAAPSPPLQQTQPLGMLQSLRPQLSAVSPVRQPAAQQPVAPLQPPVSGSVELATVLLSYLSSSELQRGLLFVNRLWRFKSLYVLQSRQVNVQVQLNHLYLGPFRASNMLELVFSLQVSARLMRAPTTGAVSNALRSPVQPLRPLQLPKSVPSSPRTPMLSAVQPTSLTSPSAVARATVCTPMGMSGVVQAKELSRTDSMLGSPSMLLGSAGKQLSKKKLREAALLAESQYNSIIECGILPPAGHTAPHHAQAASPRTFKLYSAFFGKQVEVYTALSDPAQQTLYRASSLAEKFDYATNKVGMYLSRRRLHSGGIYQATGFRSKPAGRTGLKCGGYFLTIEACKEFENHFQYGGLTEEQRNQKAAGDKEPGTDHADDVDAGDLGDAEESEDDADEAADKAKPATAVKAEERPHGKPLSAVTKKLADTHFGQSQASPASAGGGNSRKRSASDDNNPDDSPDSGDMSASPSSGFKRLRSDDGTVCTTDSGSGSDNACAVSSPTLSKRSSSDEDGSDRGSPGRSSRTTHAHSHSQLHPAHGSSSGSVGSSASFHRSAFKAPTAMRASSFQPNQSSMASVASAGSMFSAGGHSPPPAGADLSPSSSPGGRQVPMLPASAQFLPSISSSPSPPFAGGGFPALTRWHSFSSPMMSPTGSQTVFSPPPAATSYVQLSSPPMAVAHQFNGLSLAGSQAAAQQGSGAMAGAVPLSQAAGGQTLEAAFASALMQSGQNGGSGVNGPSASVGANGLLNLNNLTLQQVQHLLAGQQNTAGPAGQQQQQPQQFAGQQQQQPSLLNLVLMSAAGQAVSGLQPTQPQ